jgi:hypothetical protein
MSRIYFETTVFCDYWGDREIQDTTFVN